jgi:transposase
MEHLVECAAGLDVHRDTVVASVRRCIGKKETIETRTFETYPDSLRELAQWLKDCGVQLAGMESTGVYFKPVDRELRRAGLVSWVINAAHVKQVPGRKTDVNDSAWLSKLVMHGLVRPSFIPDAALDALRTLTRTRVAAIGDMTRIRNRIIRSLECLGIKLSTLCSDVLGKSGRAILRALLEGHMTPAQMAALAQTRMVAKRPLLERALTVSLDEDSKWVLADLLAELEHAEARVARLDARIAEHLGIYATDVQLVRQIPGMHDVSIAAVLAETGVDMSVFASAKHLASWAGLCPGNNESAGKAKKARAMRGNPWLRTMLLQVAFATSRAKNSPWRGTFARLTRSTGSVKKAAFAVAHKVLLCVYHVLRSRQYRPAQPLPITEPQRKRRIARALDTLRELGFDATLAPTATSPA